MGVINITPDSFSDGGQYISPEDALNQAKQLINDGADILDLGAESTRPGSLYVSAEEEWSRLKPVLELIRNFDSKIKISIDTRKAEIIKRCLSYKVNYINNVEGLCDTETLKILACEKDLNYIAMHMHKNPESMQSTPLVGQDAVDNVKDFMADSYSHLIKAGFNHNRIWLDPGIGFGKDDSGNLKLLAETFELSKMYNLAIGVSRKSWIGRILGIEDPSDRDHPSKMIEISQAMAGANIIRTHEIKSLARLKKLWLEG